MIIKVTFPSIFPQSQPLTIPTDHKAIWEDALGMYTYIIKAYAFQPK